MKKIRFLVFVIITAIAAACVLVLSGNNVTIIESEAGGENKINLRFAWNWDDMNVKSFTLSDVLNQFSKMNPGVSITGEFLSGDSFYNKLQVDFASKNAPDIVSVKPGNRISHLAKMGALAELQRVFRNKAGYELPFGKRIIYDGRTVGISLERYYIAMFVNSDLFRAHGIELPSTFEQLIYAAERFNEAGIIPIVGDFYDGGWQIYQSIVGRLAGRLEIGQCIADGTISESYLDGLDILRIMYDCDMFPPNCFDMDMAESINLFVTKKAAMTVRESGFIAEVDHWYKQNGIMESDTDNIVIMPFPIVEGSVANTKSYISGGGDVSFFFSANSMSNSDKKHVLEDLILYLESDIVGSLFRENAKINPSVYIPLTKEYIDALQVEETLMLLEAQEFIPPPKNVFDECVWYNYVENNFPKVLRGQIDKRGMFETAIGAYKSMRDME
ncbi:MAG: extracellular solute-binding protein [Firmicutes bacterium]|nr:extracellular solute-binding protein [Bacillota bacterium]